MGFEPRTSRSKIEHFLYIFTFKFCVIIHQGEIALLKMFILTISESLNFHFVNFCHLKKMKISKNYTLEPLRRSKSKSFQVEYQDYLQKYSQISTLYTVCVEQQCGKMKDLLSPKKISSNRLFSIFYSKNVTFTKFLLNKCDSKLS